ncbi:MAG: InlB B-repeat-containing protein, partial [Treponema sp.]|nr:InlB B-repeat-containing protein [Treponema sp.]
TFDNWYSNSGLTDVYNFSTPVTSNITLYAKWNVVTTTVTFNSNGGSAVESQTVNSGSIATLPADPTRTGYTFDNWYSNSGLTDVYNFSTPVTSNITLYAKWNVIINYTVTFHANEGSGTVPGTQSITAGSVFTIPEITGLSRAGYTLVGWTLNSAGTGTIYKAGDTITPNNDTTLYAKWNLTSIVVSFDANVEPVLEKPIIHRSASNGPVSETFTLDNPEQYDSISWRILNTNVTGTGHTFTLSTANSAYNTAGEYILTVEVKIGNAWFNRTINFTVAE